MSNKSSRWLNQKFLQWQAAEEERKTIGDFADYLGVSEGALGHWMNGRRDPAFSNAFGICDILQDYTLLEILGYKRVDQLVFDFMPEEMKIRFVNAKNEIIEKLAGYQYTPDSPEGSQIVKETFAKYDIVFKDGSGGISAIEADSPTSPSE